ncbi:hypothetical protein PFMALIP_05696, partial [Plasmodium falciparum MaliPS096_E11]
MKPNDNLENNMNLSIGKIDLSNIYMDILHIHETLVNHIQTIVTQVYSLIEKTLCDHIERNKLDIYMFEEKYKDNNIIDGDKDKMIIHSLNNLNNNYFGNDIKNKFILEKVNECILDNENDKKNKIKISSKKKYFNELLNFGNKNKNKNVQIKTITSSICTYKNGVDDEHENDNDDDDNYCDDNDCDDND